MPPTFPHPFATSSADTMAREAPAGRPVPFLPSHLKLSILRRLAPNDKALSGRLVCKDAWHDLRGSNTACLSQPLPAHATHSQQQIHVKASMLSFSQHLMLMATAASSGCETNIDIAWQLLEPRLHRGQLQAGFYNRRTGNPGVAAIMAGHPHALPWLLRRCPGLVNGNEVALTAAERCQLPALQSVLAELREAGKQFSDVDGLVDSAAGSRTPDAQAKLQWVMDAHPGAYTLRANTARAAASSGDLSRLQWLHARGCPTADVQVLAAALQYDACGSVAMTEWLLAHGGCAVPPVEDTKGRGELLEAAGASGDLVKLRWLRERGVPLDLCVAKTAAREGHIAVLQLLFEGIREPGQRRSCAFTALINCVGTRPAVLDWLHRNCAADMPDAETLNSFLYMDVAGYGDVELIKMLSQHPVHGTLREDPEGLYAVIRCWDRKAPNGKLLEAVQMLAAAGWKLGPKGPRALCDAAERGDLPLLYYIHTKLEVALVPSQQHNDGNGGEEGEAAEEGEGQGDPRVGLFASAVWGGCVGVMQWLIDTVGFAQLDVRGSTDAYVRSHDEGLFPYLLGWGVFLLECVQMGVGPSGLAGVMPCEAPAKLMLRALEAPLAWAGKEGTVCGAGTREWLRAQKRLAELQLEQQQQVLLGQEEQREMEELRAAVQRLEGVQQGEGQEQAGPEA